jgi:hypothetical protein
VTHPDVAAVAAVVHAFDGDVVDARPRGVVGRSFPDEINGHRRTIDAFARCACASRDCGTWAFYDGAPLCRACARAQWRAEQIRHWQARTW